MQWVYIFTGFLFVWPERLENLPSGEESEITQNTVHPNPVHTLLQTIIINEWSFLSLVMNMINKKINQIISSMQIIKKSFEEALKISRLAHE